MIIPFQNSIFSKEFLVWIDYFERDLGLAYNAINLSLIISSNEMDTMREKGREKYKILNISKMKKAV